MKKLIAMAMALIMVLGCGSAMAENTKHERVYVVTDAGGTVRSITDSIRLENADGLNELTDRTMMTEIVNAGGKESFTLDGETLTCQADGKDIIYQGTSDRQPAVIPTVRLTLDGGEVSAEELKTKTGEAELTVSYVSSGELPALAVTVLPLPEEGVSGLELTNAAVVTEMGRRVLVGWAVPGADETLKLPASFSARFKADHADLGWMMTLATSEPVNMLLREADGRLDLNLQTEIQEIGAVLTAMKAGEELPQVTGKTAEIVEKLRALNSGLTQLDDSAKQVAEGAGEVSDGAADLKNGLEKLTGRNEELNGGAQQMMAATLAFANKQIAGSGLEAAGVKLPELTAENYAQVLDGAIAGLEQIPEAKESLTALKNQLDQANEFVTGLKAYTDGVAQAAEGSSSLAAGAAKLNLGATALQLIGTGNLKTQILGAEQAAAEKLLPYLEGTVPDAMRIWEKIAQNAGKDGYDLRPEGMKTVTAYIIRTDLQ